MEYPIPKDIKGFFQLEGTDNNEFQAKGSIEISSDQNFKDENKRFKKE